MPTNRFPLMHELVESPPTNMPLDQWQPLYDLAIGCKPDLLLELGRGYGNSTCILTQAANELGARVVSVCFESDHTWETRTAPRLMPIVGPDWFKPLRVIQDDITTLDFRPILRPRWRRPKRVFVFWDAHGEDVATTVLNTIFPLLPRRSFVVIDDVPSDAYLDHMVSLGFQPEINYHAGPLQSTYAEVQMIWDYLTSRGIGWVQGGRWISFAPS